MLTVKDLGYWYDQEENYLFKQVNLSFMAGHSYAIVGQSGTGKTTFLSLIAGLDRPKAGRIAFENVPLAKIGLTYYRKHQVALVFQSYNLLTYMSPLENLMTALAITQSKHQGDRGYARTILSQLGLTPEQMDKNVQKLSGGQQQRVAIGRAMCCDAQLVVADEPTGNLDEQNTSEVIRLFQAIAHQQGKCVIIVTHEAEVATACDHAYRLAKRTFTEIK